MVDRGLPAVVGQAPRFFKPDCMRYFENLRWYRQAKKHLLYRISGHVLPRVYVIDGFNYWTGRVRMRGLHASKNDGRREEFPARRIEPVVFGNTTALESTIVL